MTDSDDKPITRRELKLTMRALEWRLRLTIVLSVVGTNALIAYASPVASAGVVGATFIGAVALKLALFR